MLGRLVSSAFSILIDCNIAERHAIVPMSWIVLSHEEACDATGGCRMLGRWVRSAFPICIDCSILKTHASVPVSWMRLSHEEAGDETGNANCIQVQPEARVA